MAESMEYHGSLVAFEGPSDHIPTQLRLLPTSPQIAILPSIQTYLDTEAADDGFEPRKFIRRVRNALATRNETAQSFLRASTPANKRLVFMNGGTPGAQALCVRAIAEHESHGDLLRAECIFNDLVKDGLAGLESGPVNERRAFGYVPSGLEEDPITRAMRAADALDRQTAGLQTNNDIDLSIAPRPRSMSLPIYSFADRFGDAAPFYVFGAQTDSDMDDDYEVAVDSPLDPTTPRVAVTQFDESEDGSESEFEFDNVYKSPDEHHIPPRSPSCVGEAYGPREPHYPPSPHANVMLDMLSPHSDVFSVQSTDPVVYGEASLVEMRRSFQMKPLKRVRSLDRIYIGHPRHRENILRLHPEAKAVLGQEELPAGSRPYSCIEVTNNKNSLARSEAYIEAPRTVFVRSNLSNITLSAAPLKPKRLPAKPGYVDRGTDAEDIPEDDPPFQPVFPFTEDLVIHFKDDNRDPVLESMIQAFKNGVYPVSLASSNVSEVDDQADLPGTPGSRNSDIVQNDQGRDQLDSPAVAGDAEEYDPFAYQQHTWASKKQPLHIAETMRAPAPPTPAQTPPPTLPESEDKFHDFNTVDCHTAVTMQNSLRSILNIYFPPEDQGYHQFHFPLLPELDGLWKPIFREAEPGSPRQDSSRRIDQIIAIGSQRGVKRDYTSAISGQLEKLGTKASGISRSGRVDFRYLIANAMQAFTAQPLANQTHDNPFTNSYLLATLVIPHLETYFAVHSEVRFLLLEYPPDHLATVLALQKLLGVDLMKVAKIVDSNAKEPLPFTHVRGASISRTSSDGMLSPVPSSPQMKPLPPTPTHQPESLSISKANFILTSTATPSEIATFISTVHKILVETSQFYVAEDLPKHRPSPKRAPSPLSGTFSPFPRTSSATHSPLSPPNSGISRAITRPASPTNSTKAPSVAETVKTTKSGKSRRGRSRKGEKAFGDAASTFTADPAEYDSDYDLEERRLMPMFMRKPPGRKGNSRKALKFLGLA